MAIEQDNNCLIVPTEGNRCILVWSIHDRKERVLNFLRNPLFEYGAHYEIIKPNADNEKIHIVKGVTTETDVEELFKPVDDINIINKKMSRRDMFYERKAGRYKLNNFKNKKTTHIVKQWCL